MYGSGDDDDVGNTRLEKLLINGHWHYLDDVSYYYYICRQGGHIVLSSLLLMMITLGLIPR
jgi:hypothetical protein